MGIAVRTERDQAVISSYAGNASCTPGCGYWVLCASAKHTNTQTHMSVKTYNTSGPFWALIMTNYTKYSLRILLKQGGIIVCMSIEQYCKAEDFSRMIFMMWLWKFWRERIIEIKIAMLFKLFTKVLVFYFNVMWRSSLVEYLFSGRMCAGHWVLNRDRRKLIKSQNRSRFVMKYRFINHVANRAEFHSS